MRLRASFLCLLSAVTLAACGDDEKEKTDTKTDVEVTDTTTETTTSPPESFNLSAFESQLANELNGELAGAQAGGVTADVTEVQCPDSTRPSTGFGPDCDVTGDGGLTGGVQVVFDDNTGQSYSYLGEVTVGGKKQSVSGKVGQNSNN